jgi:ribonuclease D
MQPTPEEYLSPYVDDDQVREIADELAGAGFFALDLEFVSEKRYVPDLALVQVAWGDPVEPEVALLDPLRADVTPVVELVGDASVGKVLHAAKGDLALLADHFRIEGKSIADSQIAAAFLGLGDQVGYTGLVEQVLGVELDKSSQWTDWLRRPLFDEQLRYAAADVRWLLPAWSRLEGRLEERGRLDWVLEESDRLAATASLRPPPEEAYLKIKGANRLNPRQLGVLRSLAAWRETTALDTNLPPSWLLKDRPLLELVRKPPKSPGELSGMRDVSEATVRRHGKAILQALRDGAGEPPPTPSRGPSLSHRERTWVAVAQGLVHAACRREDLAPRLVANREEIEELVAWWASGHRGEEPPLPVLRGWRRSLAGRPVLDWLSGETAVTADPESETGLRLVTRT